MMKRRWNEQGWRVIIVWECELKAYATSDETLKRGVESLESEFLPDEV